MSEIINPQDAELEEIILGSCLIESKAITLIADILRPEAFYNEKNLEIYATLQSMYQQRTENRYHNSQRRTCPDAANLIPLEDL